MTRNYKGEEGSDMGSYCSIMRQGGEGVMYGEGQGVVTTNDGKEWQLGQVKE